MQGTMKIYDINDKVILDVPVTKEAVHEQEMSKSDYVKLSWVSDAKQILPAGTYIVPFEDVLHYRLLEPYTPNQNSEIEWKYQPEFQHPLMWLSKIPFTYTTVDSSKNLSYTSQDWPYLGLTTSLLQVVVDQINSLFGFTKDDDKFTYEIIGEVSTTVNCTFSSTSILSALSTIANAASTDNTVEWHLSWEHRCLYFGQISINLGEEIPTLKVGTNIGKVSVTDTKDGYYNVFFPQGSTRNISTRLTNGHYLASSLRLGLNFPSGISYTNAFATISSVESNKKEENYFRLTLDLEYVQTYFNEPLSQYGSDIYVVRLRIDNCTVNARVEGHGDTTNVRIYSEYLENATDPDDNADKENFYAFQDKIAVGVKVYLDGGVNIYNLPEANKETVYEKFDLQYPDGTIDIRTNKNEPKQVLALTFDDVYPHVNCYVYNVRSRTSILKKSNSTEDALDKDGNPIKYSIWYFRLAYPLSTKEEGCLLNEDGTPYTTVLDGVTYYWYDYYVNKDKDIIDGYKTSLQFTANAHKGAYPQPLLGQPSATEGFEVECHQSATTVKLDDGTTVKKGDYEIVYTEQNDLIIPTTVSDGLYPRGDKMPNFLANEAIVYNVVMGANEIKAAQDELLLKTKKEIERRKQDLNNYSFSSYPNIFEDSSKNPNLYIGKTVTFDDGAGNKLSTRVIKLTTKLDHAFEQSITVGNQKIKGTTSQLKEDVQTIMSGNWNGGGGLNTAQVKNLIRTIGRSEYLRKDQDDTTEHKLTMGEAEVKGDATVKGDLKLGTDGSYSISKEGIAKLAGVVAEYLKSSDFAPGTGMGFDGQGYGITKDKGGKYTLEIDNLIARMKMIVAELEVHEMSFIGGTVVMSPCGNRVDRVEALDAEGNSIATADSNNPTLTIPSDKTAEKFRCYFLASDGDRQIKNEWTVGQLARAKTNNIAAPGNYTNYQNRDYWRLVVGVSQEPVTIEGKDYHYIDLSNSASKDIVLTDTTGTERHVTLGGVSETLNSLPFAGDNVIGIGHCWDDTRKNVAILSVDSLGWKLYKGIDHYDLPEENIVNQFSIDKTIVTTDHFILRPYAAPKETQTVAVVRGEYSDTNDYGHNDMVTYEGQTWIASGVAIGNTIKGEKPSETSAYWSLAAAKGIQGETPTFAKLRVNHSALHYNPTTQKWDYEEVTVSIVIFTPEGTKTPANGDTTEYYWVLDNDTYHRSSGDGFSATLEVASHTATLYKVGSNVPLDTITVPMLRDGEKGATSTGAAATVYTIEPCANFEATGKLTDASHVTVSISGDVQVYKTIGDQKTLCGSGDGVYAEYFRLSIGGTNYDGKDTFTYDGGNIKVSKTIPYEVGKDKNNVPGSATITLYDLISGGTVGNQLASLVVPVSLNPGAIVDVNSELGTIQNTTTSLQGTIETIKQGQGQISLKVQDLQSMAKSRNLISGGNVTGLYNKRYEVFRSSAFKMEQGKTYTVTARLWMESNSNGHNVIAFIFGADYSWTPNYSSDRYTNTSASVVRFKFTAGGTKQMVVAFYEQNSSGTDPLSYNGVHVDWLRVDEGDWTGVDAKGETDPNGRTLDAWTPAEEEIDALNLLPDPDFSEVIGYSDAMGERNSYDDNNMGGAVPGMSSDSTTVDGYHALRFERKGATSVTSAGLRYIVPFRGAGTYSLSCFIKDLHQTDANRPVWDSGTVFAFECHPMDANKTRITGGFAIYATQNSQRFGDEQNFRSYTFGTTATRDNGNGTTTEVRIAFLEVRVFLLRNGSVRVSRLCLSKSDHFIYWNANELSEERKKEAAQLATGIDIYSHKIIATTDKFVVQNNSGDPTFSIDKDGNIVGEGDAYFKGTITGSTINGSTFISTSTGQKSTTTIAGGQITTNNITANGGTVGGLSLRDDGLYQGTDNTPRYAYYSIDSMYLRGRRASNNNSTNYQLMFGFPTEEKDGSTVSRNAVSYANHGLNGVVEFIRGTKGTNPYLELKGGGANDPEGATVYEGTNECALGVKCGTSGNGYGYGIVNIGMLATHRLTVLTGKGSSNVTLQTEGFYVATGNGMTITMPDNPQKGAFIIIIQQVSGKINFNGNGYSFCSGGSTRSTAFSNVNGQWSLFVFDGDYWQGACLNGGTLW